MSDKSYIENADLFHDIHDFIRKINDKILDQRIKELEGALKKIQHSAEKKGLIELILAEIYVITQKALEKK